MTFSSRASFAVSLVAALALFGAGCASSSPSSNNGTPSTSTTTNPVPTTPPSGANGGELPSTISTSSTLDTTGWQTYENKTLKFSFKYPLKGSFAPEFSVKLLPLTSAEIENDCTKSTGLPQATQQRLTVNGTTFCRTNTLEGAAGSTYNQDAWVTKTEKWYAIITFTKRYVTDPRIIAGCEEGGANTAQARCRPFDVNGYHQQLEGIMSTFQFPAAS